MDRRDYNSGPHKLEGLAVTLEKLEESLGESHRRCIQPRHRLAHACRAAGRFEEALRLFRSNFHARSQLMGPQHPATFRSLANCYYAAAEYTQAISLFQEILTGRTRVLGASHPDTLRSLGSLANTIGLPANTSRRPDFIKKPWPLANALWDRTTPAPGPAAAIWRPACGQAGKLELSLLLPEAELGK